jgi:hypothetical protein
MKKVILASAILSLGFAEANADCNSATLKGAYITGYSVFFPSIPAFCAGVGIGKSDGIDRFTVSGIESCNGNIFSVSGQGVYFVRANCTGEAAVTFSNGTTVLPLSTCGKFPPVKNLPVSGSLAGAAYSLRCYCLTASSVNTARQAARTRLQHCVQAVRRG